MFKEIQIAMEDDKLAQEYLGNFESLLKMVPQVRDVISNSKYHINEGVLLSRFLQLLDWFIIDYDSRK